MSTVHFKNPVYIRSWAVCAGKKEGEGPLGDRFDVICPDGRYGEKSWEKAEMKMVTTAWQTALQKAGLPLNKDYIFTMATTIDGAYENMKRYLSEKVKLPTAFFADNDMIALGAMKAMAEFGIRIPEDISIVGFDDLTFSSISYPPLTTLRVPKQEMGRAVVRRLRNILKDNDGIKIKMQMCTQFIERESVKKI